MKTERLKLLIVITLIAGRTLIAKTTLIPRYSNFLKPLTFNYFMNGQLVERVNSFDDLVVILDTVVSKARRMLGFVLRISREFQDTHTHTL
jgi:hypothetical protein